MTNKLGTHRVVFPPLLGQVLVIVAVVEGGGSAPSTGGLHAELLVGDADELPPAPVEPLGRDRFVRTSRQRILHIQIGI